ncbi:MAG: hypothetical protein B6D79_02035, partial [gamma proteobacterium symbiont of Ctena orbiculata]
MKLVISIVYYDSGLPTLRETLVSIVKSLDYAASSQKDLRAKVVIVDNGGILTQVRQMVSDVFADSPHEWMVLGTG